MTGVEIDFVVSDSLQALALYERVFEVERIEATSFERGRNEVVFSVYGARFHMLDENPECGLVAPVAGAPCSIWYNITVPDIAATHRQALAQGCSEIQEVREMASFGVSNSMFRDPFGYVWMLHQVYREVDFAERAALMKDL